MCRKKRKKSENAENVALLVCLYISVLLSILLYLYLHSKFCIVSLISNNNLT